ncbi:hypothetical protein GGU45_000502 [Niabella hirudinis]
MKSFLSLILLLVAFSCVKSKDNVKNENPFGEGKGQFTAWVRNDLGSGKSMCS